MALRIVIERGDPQLERKSRKIEEINDRMKELAGDLIDTMEEYDGVGIAAPQVGVSRCMCVVSFLDDKPPKVLINPEIIEKKGRQVGEEGCLSVPGYLGEVERPQWVKLKYLDLDGKEHIEEHEDFGAVVVSHEIDHLNGELYGDKAISFYTVEEAQAKALAEAEARAGSPEEGGEPGEASDPSDSKASGRSYATEQEAAKRAREEDGSEEAGQADVSARKRASAKKAKAARKSKKKNKRKKK